ncbi:hypothetical protein AOC36_00260 [Erysipelothrix larvae]|uniref:Impact N-terminal domain-containing protein n=1 Tax=Erysipelothrix larvae TaxID=1514105 RepID=A0A0X8GXY8_9FIRM|nr:YigZ family protein [Erysipelothrix larvae]AMC92479.1 hypothetical protein AOC36_00260 [Erysipelothrix larvae]
MKKTIAQEVVTELYFQKSQFITYLTPIQSETEAKEVIKRIKKEHPKATHHCVAYVVEDIERSNDDGEPASSAGLPMLQVLRGNDLDYVLAVVVRYFGGTLLGVGGLIRAYGSSVKHAIDTAQILIPQEVTTVNLRFPYEYINAVETFLSENAEIIDRNYETLAIYDIKTKNPEQLNGLIDITRGKITIQIVTKKIEYSKEG